MSEIQKPSEAFSPLLGANNEGWGFLQKNQENIPHPGVDYNIRTPGAKGWAGEDDGAPVVVPWDGVVVGFIPKLLYSWGRLVVVRHVLPYDVTSAGLLVPKGTVVYSQMAHLSAFNGWKGKTYKAGELIARCGGSNGAMPGPYKVGDKADPNGQWWPHLHYGLRIGGPKGLPLWDRGDERAIQEWPSVQGYGYPAIANYDALVRACRLRWLDPCAAIPASIQPSRYVARRVW